MGTEASELGPASPPPASVGAHTDGVSGVGRHSGKASASVSWSDAVRGALSSAALARTIPAALVVGTTLWFVNLAHVYFAGLVTPYVLVQSLLTYLIPWLNATFGMAMAFHSPLRAQATLNRGARKPLPDSMSN